MISMIIRIKTLILTYWLLNEGFWKVNFMVAMNHTKEQELSSWISNLVIFICIVFDDEFKFGLVLACP